MLRLPWLNVLRKSKRAWARAGCLGQARVSVLCTTTRTILAVLCSLTVVVTLTGCVRRTLRITTTPPQALVYLNDQEVGHSELTTDFLWYGDYDVTIRKEGYQTLHTNWNVEPPWYQIFPFDFFSDVLWPGQLHDLRERHFELIPAVPVDPETLIERAMVTRDRALDPRK